MIASAVLLLGGCSSSSDERVTLSFVVPALTGASISDVRTLAGESPLVDASGEIARFHAGLVEDCGHEPAFGAAARRAVVEVAAGDGSERVTRFEEVVSGPLTFSVAFNADEQFRDFGGVESPQGAGPLELEVPRYLAPFWDARSILDGTGRVRVRAETHRAPTDSFSLDIRIEVELADAQCDVAS